MNISLLLCSPKKICDFRSIRLDMSTGIKNHWLKTENAGFQLAAWAFTHCTPPIHFSTDLLTQIHEAAVTSITVLLATGYYARSTIADFFFFLSRVGNIQQGLQNLYMGFVLWVLWSKHPASLSTPPIPLVQFQHTVGPINYILAYREIQLAKVLYFFFITSFFSL